MTQVENFGIGSLLGMLIEK